MRKKIVSYICIFSILISVFSFSMQKPAYAEGFTITDLASCLLDDGLLNIFFDRWTNEDFNSSIGCPRNEGGPHEWHFEMPNPLLPGFGYYRCLHCYMYLNEYVDEAYHDTLEENNMNYILFDSNGNRIAPVIVALGIPMYNHKIVGTGNGVCKSLVIENNIQFANLNVGEEREICPIGTGYCKFYCQSKDTVKVRLYFEDDTFSESRNLDSNVFPCKFQLHANYSNSTVSLNIVKGNLTYAQISVNESYVLRLNSSTFPSNATIQNYFTTINNVNTTNLTVATTDESQNITNVYQNTTVINNDNTTFTLPGGSSYPVQDWNFSFDGNTYQLTVLDNDVEVPVTVKFGIDDLNIKFGDQEYNFKYVTEKQTEPSPSPTPVDPSPTPGPVDPTSSPSRPDGWPEDYDTDDTPMWNRLFFWLDDFKTWLGQKLDSLLNRETEITVDPNIEIVLPTGPPGIHYTDEEGNEFDWDPNTLKEKFAFWTDVRDIGQELYASVQPTRSGEAPELIIHLGAAQSPYGFHYGGDQLALDLSWYGEYKPTVDSITGGFLWLVYLFGVFKNLPGIVSGMGMVDNRVEDIEAGRKGVHNRRK